MLKNGRGFELDLHKYHILAESTSLQGHYKMPSSIAAFTFKPMLFPGWLPGELAVLLMRETGSNLHTLIGNAF